MSKWHVFTDTDQLDRALARHLAQQLSDHIAEHGEVSLAVSGGATPTGMFRQLSRCELAWEHVWLTLVDERRVATDSPDSNERLLRENLLQNRAATAHFVSMADKGAAGLESLEQAVVTMPGPLAAVVLGMGGDGHTASWFPGAANLAALLDPKNLASVAATEPPTAPHGRLTLTLAAVLRSREIIIHITGETKKSVLEKAIERDYPVAAVLQQTTTPASIWWAP